MNKINFLIGLASVIILSSCGSKPYKVERKAEIATPSEYVFNIAGNNKFRADWSPWDKLDPGMKKEYDGPDSGVGAKYAWSSENENVGTGSMECIESNSPIYMKSNLAFTAPWESTSIVEWNFEENEGVTSVTWSVSGELPGMAAMFTDMEKNLGPSLEEGLTNLKTHCEENYKAPEVLEMPMDTAAVDSAEMNADNVVIL